MPAPRPGRVRAALLVAAVVVTPGLAAVVASRSAWVRSWFARDAENAAEMAQLDAANLSAPPPPDTAGGWPQWRGPNRDGHAPAGAIRTDWDKRPPKQLWSAACGGGYSSLAVAGGKVYGHDRTADGERVFCRDAATGNKSWEYAYPADYAPMRLGYAAGPRATPAVAGGRVYAVGAVGKLLCLEPAAAGQPPKLVWEHDLIGMFGAAVPTWGVACSPLVEGDTVVVQPGGKVGSVVAFDAATGAVRWNAGGNPGGYSSPVAATVGGVRVILALTGDALLCVRAADGEVTGRYDWKTEHFANIATPVVVGDYVFVSSAYNKGCALLRAVAAGDRVKLEEVYARNNRVLRSHLSTPVYAGGFLYGFDGTRTTTLTCVDFRKGAAAPGWADADVRSGTLVLADRHLLILTEGGRLNLVEATPEGFRPVAEAASGLSGAQNWALPVLLDGRLYLRGEDKIVCLDVSP